MRHLSPTKITSNFIIILFITACLVNSLHLSQDINPQLTVSLPGQNINEQTQVGLPSPQYVRSVTFENLSGNDVDVEVLFQSGQTLHYVVGKQPLEVQKTIEHDTWTSVDPVQSFKVNFGQGEDIFVSCSDAETVQKRTYVISDSRTIQRKEDE